MVGQVRHLTCANFYEGHYVLYLPPRLNVLILFLFSKYREFNSQEASISNEQQCA